MRDIIPLLKKSFVNYAGYYPAPKNFIIMKALLELRKLRAKEKALKAKIEATEIMAIIEAQNLTEGGKFSYKGHEFILDHVDHFRIKCLD